ncbi:DUF3455 domain-containing protein [Rugamonas sp.]|uniref:DUF3455 domain-containing protein n=1 Tax=Rugamonas sp. TaxID=1926287 RepID=UPI0025D0CC64|nr:DUF3455 domain-containing protein [Rugamonas sp.]
MTLRYATLLAVTALAAPFAVCAADIAVPDPLQVAPGQKLVLDVRGVGVQIYVCSALAADASRFEWHFKAPEAELYEGDGRKVGKHYAGPTWESNDGSKVVGAVKAHQDDARGAAIPWLLLNAKSTQGAGMFGKVDAIQRLATEGGLAPKDGCGAAQLGQELRVPYQAVYRFFSAD